LPNGASNINYNEANQMLIFEPEAQSAKNMTYDENGNLLTLTNGCGTTDYTWDVRNRLSSISGFNTDCSALSASFKYDALGRRIEKTINGVTTQYLYDGLDIVQEIENSVVTADYIRTLNIDEPLARVKADGSERYYQTDALGSVIALTDDAGAVRTQYSYDPYGSTTTSGESSDNPFQYTGRENDNTGLSYYRARYYSPELQRFISEDPIRLGGGINFFGYVGNNPIRFRDPKGLMSCKKEDPECMGRCRATYFIFCSIICDPTIELPPLFLACNITCFLWGERICEQSCEK
jgi:RHS repeat-associated protein